MEITIRTPQTEQEWNEYYDLRYRILRQPWNQPIGSERNEGDETGKHFALFEDKKLKAIARLDVQSEKQVQVRFMAVEKDIQRKGYGKKVMLAIENHSKNEGYSEIILHARELAIPFYESLEYELVEKSHLLFGEIQHYLMNKFIK